MRKGLFVAFFFWLAASGSAAAHTVLPVDLDTMIATAAVAFEGTCTGNRSERDTGSNLVVTYTTFSVRDALKGQVGQTYEIKQIGGDLPGGLKYHVDGMPHFQVGQDYVVFLNGVSAAGFSSPVGLEQGRFTVTAGSTGAEVANGRDFRELTASVPVDQLPASLQARAKRGEAVPRLNLDEFKQLVRNRARGVK